jgi:hypothetical protein
MRTPKYKTPEARVKLDKQRIRGVTDPESAATVLAYIREGRVVWQYSEAEKLAEAAGLTMRKLMITLGIIEYRTDDVSKPRVSYITLWQAKHYGYFKGTNAFVLSVFRDVLIAEGKEGLEDLGHGAEAKRIKESYDQSESARKVRLYGGEAERGLHGHLV